MCMCCKHVNLPTTDHEMCANVILKRTENENKKKEMNFFSSE